jgi:methyl-accepting chemotaxis protein
VPTTQERTAPRGAGRGVSPTGEARTSASDELIVSRTDLRGLITYANDVFLRISRYELHDVIGRPHNLIRHPEMPRAVFHRFHRSVLLGGLAGAYRKGAAEINAARDAMQATAGRVTEATTARLRLADEFETVVLSTSEQVATAATELSASASGLTGAASAAGAQTTTAQETMSSLTRSAAEIRDVIALIDAVAAQTRLLALNATIEAARAGEAGKGFAVVASEVKDLADETGRATDRVITQVEQMRAACEEVASGMTRVGATVTEMNGVADGIAAAVDGSASLGPGGQDVTGLSQLAGRAAALGGDRLPRGDASLRSGVPFDAGARLRPNTGTDVCPGHVGGARTTSTGRCAGT